MGTQDTESGAQGAAAAASDEDVRLGVDEHNLNSEEDIATSAAPILDDVLIALQKSLSRVSCASSLVPDHHARALISGDVNFSIELRVDNLGDRLLLNRDGDIKLSMNGKITPDIRSVSEDDVEEENDV